jgi:L-lactate dehydrogenase complex protein LldF
VRDGLIQRLPGMLAGWTASRDLHPIPRESFREWWAKREKQA